MSALINDAHLSKPAYIYVRQSTLAQVRHHQESTERQYALRDKALAMGWPQRKVRVLDRCEVASKSECTGAVFSFEPSR